MDAARGASTGRRVRAPGVPPRADVRRHRGSDYRPRARTRHCGLHSVRRVRPTTDRGTRSVHAIHPRREHNDAPRLFLFLAGDASCRGEARRRRRRRGVLDPHRALSRPPGVRAARYRQLFRDARRAAGDRAHASTGRQPDAWRGRRGRAVARYVDVHVRGRFDDCRLRDWHQRRAPPRRGRDALRVRGHRKRSVRLLGAGDDGRRARSSSRLFRTEAGARIPIHRSHQARPERGAGDRGALDDDPRGRRRARTNLEKRVGCARVAQRLDPTQRRDARGRRPNGDRVRSRSPHRVRQRRQRHAGARHGSATRNRCQARPRRLAPSTDPTTTHREACCSRSQPRRRASWSRARRSRSGSARCTRRARPATAAICDPCR